MNRMVEPRAAAVLKLIGPLMRAFIRNTFGFRTHGWEHTTVLASAIRRISDFRIILPLSEAPRIALKFEPADARSRFAIS
jgi:hypothetical protein